MENKKAIYDNAYKREHYDSLKVRVPKGKSAEYTQAAQDLGLGKMELIRLAVEEYIYRHRDNPPVLSKQQEQSLAPELVRLIDDYAKLPTPARVQIARLIATLANLNPDNNQA